MVVIDTHLARGASNGGFTFHDRGGPYGRTKGAKRIVAVDVTGLPVGALVVAASTHENATTELMLEHLTEQGVAGRLDLVLVDRGVTRGRRGHAGPSPRSRGAPRRVGRQAAGVPFHPARLAGRGRPRTPRPVPSTGEVVREHHHLRDRLAPGCLHRDHPAPPIRRSGEPTRTPDRSVRARGMWQMRTCRTVAGRRSRCHRSARRLPPVMSTSITVEDVTAAAGISRPTATSPLPR